jgi:ParB/RepB/Spo0J family partition protein
VAKDDYADPFDLIIVGLDTEDGHTHPLFDERVFLELNESFVRNVIVYGVQQSVLVREEAGKKYVVAGRQRVRAAREASKRADAAGEHGFKVPIRRVVAEDVRVAGIGISENEIREDDDVLTRAKKAARLLNQLHDENEVAIAFGKTPTTIRNWMRLVEADPAVHQAIREGRISASAGIEIAGKPREEQKELLDRLVRMGESKGKPASESMAKKATDKTRKPQPGVKRTWLRRALQTERAEALTDEQRGVLEWIVTGEAEKGSWYDEFQWDAAAEIEDGGKKGEA